jgi:hypothetical protein
VPTLINVCGPSYSGTTILDLMLGNAPEAFSCGEVYGWFRPWRDFHSRIDCLCGADPCPYWEPIKAVAEREFHGEVCRRLGVQFVVDSSKALSWVLDNNGWTRTSGLKVVNVLVWKDPLAHAHSHWKRGITPDVAGYHFVRYYQRFEQLRLPFVSINYNRLVQSPDEQLGRLCAAIGMPWFPGKERFWTKQPHHLFGNRTVRAQLGGGNMELRVSERLSEEFLQAVRSGDTERKTVRGLEQAVDMLQRHDVARLGASAIEQAPPRLPLILPWWYYRDKFQALCRRHFRKPATRRVPGRRPARSTEQRQAS